MEDYSDFTEFIIYAQTLEKGPQEYVCTTDNTTLYLHHPDRNAQFDHLFRELAPDEIPEEYQNLSANLGGFIWRAVLGEEDFEEIATKVSMSCNFNVVYKPEPSNTDRRAFEDYATTELQAELDDLDIDDFLN